MKTKQHGSSTNHEERKRRLVEIIPQDVERNRGNDWCVEDGKEFKENSRRNQYNDYKDRGNDSDGQYQQSNGQHHEHHTNIRRPSIYSIKWHGWTSITNPENAGWQTRPI